MISIPNYTIEKEIGRGGMATVYLAIQDKLKRKVALKVMTPEMAKDKNFRKSFMSEATIIASLDHPNIVRIYDVEVVDDSTLYMAMEYLSGGTLKEKLLNGKFPLLESIKLIEQISNGLSHAHDKGYIHRDIKPGNILFRRDGSAVLTDFGIAKLEDTSGELTKMGFTMGTLQYMSPEQVVTTNLDQRSDIYSVGLVFYEMLSGLKAFRAESTVQAIHQHTTVPPPKLAAEYSHLQPVIDKVLAKQPENRYQKIVDFIKDIKESGEADKTVIHRLPVDDDTTRIFTTDATTQVSIPEQAPKVAKKKSAMGLAVAGVALVAGGLFTVYKTQFENDPTTSDLRPITPSEKIVSEQEALLKPINLKINYFHEPQIKYAKYEYELEALQKTTKDLLAISPNNQKAQGTLKLILTKYTRLAEEYLKAMNPNRANVIINKGLEVSKDEISLTHLKNIIDNKRQEAEGEKLEIQNLLKGAQKYIENGSYVLPLGENALENYQEILLLEPKNKKAAKKIKSIKSIFERAIEANMSTNRIEANNLINQARALFPYDEKFIQLQQKIKSMINH